MSEELQTVIADEAAKYLKDVRTTIRSALELSTLSLLGIEKRHGNSYEIDHCNGRASVLIDAFRAVAIEEAKKIAKNYVPSSAEVVGFASMFQKEFNRHFNESLQYMAREKAKVEASKIINSIELDVSHFMGTEIKKRK